MIHYSSFNSISRDWRCGALPSHRLTVSVHRSRPNQTRAYTLVELLIVIAVLGIAASLLIPNMVNRDWMNAQAAVRMVIGDLNFAQSDALAHQELRRVHFYEDGRGYCIVRITQTDLAIPFDEAATSHDYIVDPLGRPGAAGTGHYIVDLVADDRFSGMTISAVNIDGNNRDLQYDSLGGTIKAGGSSGVPGTGGSIVVTSGDESYQINIAPFTGKLTVIKL
jgi:prepilin-type N-terminal cleavage/methylation domain-containing protein